MSDKWAEAYYPMVQAIEAAKEAGVEEGEVLSAVDDVYHEKSDNFERKLKPKRPRA